MNLLYKLDNIITKWKKLSFRQSKSLKTCNIGIIKKMNQD